jgi:hypothetical protein
MQPYLERNIECQTHWIIPLVNFFLSLLVICIHFFWFFWVLISFNEIEDIDLYLFLKKKKAITFLHLGIVFVFILNSVISKNDKIIYKNLNICYKCGMPAPMLNTKLSRFIFFGKSKNLKLRPLKFIVYSINWYKLLINFFYCFMYICASFWSIFCRFLQKALKTRFLLGKHNTYMEIQYLQYIFWKHSLWSKVVHSYFNYSSLWENKRFDLYCRRPLLDIGSP